MEIRPFRRDEYRSMIDLMNLAFGFQTPEAQFEHILPKLYFPDNPDMIHIGCFVDGIPVSSIGLYRMDMEHKGYVLKVGCVGAVSTHPGHRKKGYFTAVLNEIIRYAEEQQYDLLFLGGNRFRYGHFGFENAGRQCIFRFTKRTRPALPYDAYETRPVSREDSDVIDQMFALYNRLEMKTILSRERFYDMLISWNAQPYAVFQNDQLKGFYSLFGQNGVSILVHDGPIETILESILDLREDATVILPMTYYESLLPYCDGFTVTNNEMYKILNEDHVIRFLCGEGKQFEGLPEDPRRRARMILGDTGYDSVTGINMFLSHANSG
ncbi:MAG: GNAT family N-acetyltransferase [Clostridia bacterium]|nr:GNAT family N-acetyltransferase [Clostridia bacterium]